MKNNNKRVSKINLAAEAAITIASMTVLHTLGLIVVQSIVAPSFYIHTPKSELIALHDDASPWDRYRLFIAESTTTEPVEIFFSILAAISLLHLTGQIADRTFYRLFQFISKTFNISHK
ncbi:MAG: hypothetical protein WBA41_12875 [Rivularia sp. (in: cyanobacteria)]